MGKYFMLFLRKLHHWFVMAFGRGRGRTTELRLSIGLSLRCLRFDTRFNLTAVIFFKT